MNKDHTIFFRMDNKLYSQLKRYADRNDEGNVSVSARKALKKFLEEQSST